MVLTYAEWKKIAMQRAIANEGNVPVAMTQTEQAEFYFSQGWEMALLVARSGTAAEKNDD